MGTAAYLWSVRSQMAQGLVITLEATGAGMAIALTVGLGIAVIRVLKLPGLSQVARFYILFFRNTPLLVQLYVWYYVLPQYGIVLSAFLVGVVGLGIQFSAYTAEVYRAGLEQVPRGQWEAGSALGLRTAAILRSIIIPQAFRPIVPGLGNYLISMFKDSAYLSVVTVFELLGTTEQLAASSFRYTALFTLLGVIYFSLSYPASVCVRVLERRAARGRQNALRS
ncbi:MAG: ectoine/hydroxyectoine ABC transporter permease subunit EhuD [Acidimicrobiales bacterium]